MKGIQNFLEIINENWVSILVCLGLVVGIAEKTISFFKKSNDEQIEIAKTQIQQTMLKLITSAEIDFNDWNESGSIKRSQVIEEIFAKYPILSRATNQNEIIEWLDSQINTSLKTLRSIVKSNQQENTTTV